MKKQLIALSVLVSGALLAGCSGALSTNGTSVNPVVSQANLGNDKLEFAVGTANYQGQTFLNTVVSYRQPNGLSAVLLDTPTIAGPSGFTVPAVASAGVDGGTNHISGTAQVVPNNPAPPPATPSTFNQSGGAYSYGFAPFNSSTTGAANYPGNPALYAQPFYCGKAAPAPVCGQLRFYGGSPAFPFFNDGTFPAGFLGYPQGFTMFGATPVSGQYTLTVNVPASNAAQQNVTANANLDATVVVGLPTLTGIAPDGKGGISGQITPGTGSTETLIYVRDVTKGVYYTVGPITAAGTFSLPDTLGPCSAKGCGANDTTPSISSGDTYQVYAVSFDYPAFEAAPPANTSQSPTISNAKGQADLAVSAPQALAYP